MDIKSSKNENIRPSLYNYLRHRNYTSANSNPILSQSAKQFKFNKMIDEDTSRVNSFLYSNVLCLTNHYNLVEQHFLKFIQFVEKQQKEIKEELSNLFGPLISHIYIELLKGRDWKPAHEFLHNHAHLVAPIENLNAPLPDQVNGCSVSSIVSDEPTTSTSSPSSSSVSTSANATTSTSHPKATTQILFVNESTGNPTRDHFKEIICNLSTCLRFEDLEDSELLSLLRSSKYDIEISLKSINTLRQYLEKLGHVLILNIFQTWIHFTIRDLKANDDNEENQNNEIDDDNIEDLDNLKDKKKISNRAYIKHSIKKISAKRKTSSSNIHLKRLKNVLSAFDNIEAPTRTMKIYDLEKSISNATIDLGQCHMVAAYNDSTVRLWQLNHNTYLGRNLYERIHNRICDWVIENEYEEEFEDCDYKKSKEQANFFSRKYKENSFDDSGSIMLRGHGRGVTDCTFSKRFPLLFTSSKDCTVRAWKSKDYSCGAVYKGHNYPIWCLSESPVGTYLATGSRDLTARLWSIDHDFPLLTYVGHTQDVDCIAFHPNGNYLATGSCDLSVRLWCVTSGKLFRVFTECRYPVTTISFSPDGKYLAAAGEENKIRIFDLAAGSQINELNDLTSTINHITWNSNGKKIASCCLDGTVKIWDITKIEKTTPSSSSSPSSSMSTTLVTSGTLQYKSTCNRGLKVFFNSNDTVTLIGTVTNQT